MNYRGGWALIKGLWLSWLQYRSFFFILAFGWMIPPLIYLFVWTSAVGQGTLNGYSRGAFVAYYLVMILVNQITYAQTNWTVGDLIRSGDFNRILLRPISPLYDALASEIAGKVVYLVFDLPVVIGLAVLLKPEFQVTAVEALAFIPALLLAWALRFFWGYGLALFAFWSSRADALLALQDTLIFLIGGQIAPLALLPGWLGQIAKAAPFRYMLAFPVEILTGSLSANELAQGLVLQGFWVVLTVIAYRMIWKSGLRRYSAVGG